MVHECAYFVIQLCATACLWVHKGSNVCSVCLLPCQIYSISYFMSHLAQLREGRDGWQSASPLVSGGEGGGASNKPTRSQARHSCIYLNMEGDGRGGLNLTDKHTGRLMVFGPVDKKHQQSDPTVRTIFEVQLWEHTSSGQPLGKPCLPPSLFPLWEIAWIPAVFG